MLKYHSSQPFILESGAVLPELEIAYHTYGSLNDRHDNVIWVCHALTANSDVAQWWPHTVESGCFLDPERWFVVCANIIGSHYGTTGPLSINPETGSPYYDKFPAFTIRDMASAHALLADALGINNIHCLIGSSVGGFQAIEWAAMPPRRFDKLVLIATAPKASPWSIAIDETQRMAIMADTTYGSPSPEAGANGLEAARAIGLLTYRGAAGYNRTQQDAACSGIPETHRACTYQRYQGEKLRHRFNAYSYVKILDAFDTHDVGRGRGGVVAALEKVNTPAMVVGISSDMIFPPHEMLELAAMLPHGSYAEIESDFGHDGFLVEHKLLNNILINFI